MSGFSRRTFLAGSAATAFGLSLLGACTRDGATGGDRRLRILNWPDYIDDESVARFEQQAGAPVDYVEEYNGNEEAFDELFRPRLGEGRSTGYDVIVPTYWAVDRMLAEGWLEPLPLERIPNHANVDPAFLGMPWDRGARFHMPWQVGITGIAYDPAQTKKEIRSMADLLDPSLRGRIGMVSEMRETVGLLMLARGADPSRATVPAAEAALERLEQLVTDGHVAGFTANEFVDALKTGQFAAALAWSGDIIQLQAERPDIRFVIPAEGGIRWFDSMIIPKGASRPDLAGDWMNFAYAPENAARITASVQYISPVLGVREELERAGGESAALADNPILFPDDETRRRLYFWSGMTAAEEDRIQERFTEITGG
ncbi:MAG TPA: spermidine/putrescine ABC transporter substrate-binding protein [Acidimicrobiales bacterium]|jgi:spermidine/putrescine transport system substrate-binding protein|nr:spermidine/putrescine ABC transporter substrate-binding protein [Acidimicrobiales bacterium]